MAGPRLPIQSLASEKQITILQPADAGQAELQPEAPAKEPAREISVEPESDQLNSQVGGRLKFFFKQWEKLTSDSFVLKCV